MKVSPIYLLWAPSKVNSAVIKHLNQNGSVHNIPEITPQFPPAHTQPSNLSSTSSNPRNYRTYPSKPTVHARSQILRPANISPSINPIRSPSDTFEKPYGVRFSDRIQFVRPPTGRLFSRVEPTTIDRKWGRLFDNGGRPTQRLGACLRGLANHIVRLPRRR